MVNANVCQEEDSTNKESSASDAMKHVRSALEDRNTIAQAANQDIWKSEIQEELFRVALRLVRDLISITILFQALVFLVTQNVPHVMDHLSQIVSLAPQENSFT